MKMRTGTPSKMASTIQELAAKLSEHEDQLYKVTKLLQLTPDDADLLKMQQDLQQLVALTKTLQANVEIPAEPAAKEQPVEAANPPAHSQSRFQKNDRVVAMWEDGEWYFARIENVNVPEDVGRVHTYDVFYLEYGNSWTVSDEQIQPYVPAPQDALVPGTNVRAIYPADGMMHPARVVGTGSGLGHFVIQFKMQLKGKQAEVMAYDIVLDPKADAYDRRKAEERAKLISADTFDIPEYLKPRDSDSKQQRENKKQKVRSLKSEWKKRKLTEQGEKKKDSWLSFRSGLEKRKGKRLKRSIFSTSDEGKVGVVGSGREVPRSAPRKKQYVAAGTSLPPPPSFEE